MYVDEERLVIGKKKNIIDDEGPVSKKILKKQKKNLNKTVHSITKQQEFVDQDKSNKTVPEDPPKPKNKKGPDRMIEDIKAILSNHKVETILRVLEKHNFNKMEAMDQLFDTPEDETNDGLMESFDEIDTQMTKKKKEKTKEQQANQFLDGVYENLEEEGLQMNPTQFEELFEEITMIIQEQQKSKGVGLVEINDFVDSCVSIKSMMMEGHELYIDENDPIFRETENFMYEIIQKNAMLEKKRQQQFPTLSALGAEKKINNKNKNPSEQKNLIQKIQQGYKIEKSKEQLFTKSKVPTISNNNNNYSYEGSIYSLNQDYQSHADVLQLSKEYNNMGIENLKFIYFRLQHDINLCKQFLQRYYPGTRSAVKVENQKQIVKPIRKRSYEPTKKIVDQNYKKYSLNEIRDELDHLYKLRNMFRITRGKITNQAYRKELDRLSCREDPRIKKLCEVARIKVIEEMAQSHPQYVDLHGYREEEIDQLMDDIREMVNTEARRGNSQIQTKRVGGSSYCVVKIMTGKGRHSKYGKSILKPAVMDWSESRGLKTVESEDSIDVYFRLN